MAWKRKSVIIIILAGLLFFLLGNINNPVEANGNMQQQDTSIPTVTGTPNGPFVTVLENGTEQFVNVRSGPGSLYEKIGVLIIGQKAPALGKSKGGDYILIRYEGVPGNEGWVYSAFVTLNKNGGSLQIVEPPPTPTPLMTSTIDPTLAAQFNITSVPTRLSTFTQPAPLSIPTFTAEGISNGPGNIPMGMVIFALGAIGVILGVFSLAQRK
jgi:hypothetical protein